MISIILPFYNEAGNLDPLAQEIIAVCSTLQKPYEVIFVNDGSEDRSADEVRKISGFGTKIRLVNHRTRRGKGVALGSGIAASKGSLIIFMDADRQNDPHDIPLFIEKLNDGYDFVNSIRSGRSDNFLIRMYSRLANLFAHYAMHSPFTDINSAFKAMRREVLDEVVLYGNNFRFLPIGVYLQGFRVTEVPITNRPRGAGISKFGVLKVFTGLLDTMTAYFLYRFSERPLAFFGAIGGISFVFGFLVALYLSIERIFYYQLLYRRPLLQFAVLLMIVGIQIIMTGFIGELVVYLDKRRSIRQ